MPVVSSHKYRVALACAVVAVAVAATATAFARPATDVTTGSVPGLYCYESDGFRYEYHAPSGYEGLYEIPRTPGPVVDVIDRHRDVAARCRRALEEKLNVASLASLREEFSGIIHRLRALGYL